MEREGVGWEVATAREKKLKDTYSDYDIHK